MIVKGEVVATISGSGPRIGTGTSMSGLDFAAAESKSTMTGGSRSGGTTNGVQNIVSTGRLTGAGFFVNPNSSAPCAAAAKQTGRIYGVSIFIGVGVSKDKTIQAHDP